MIRFLLFFALAGTLLAAPSSVSVNALRVEHLVNPTALTTGNPRFSWQLVSEERGAYQKAYQIQVAKDEESLAAGKPLVWDSGETAGNQSHLAPTTDVKFPRDCDLFWRVRIWDLEGQTTAWSAPPGFASPRKAQSKQPLPPRERYRPLNAMMKY